MPPGLFAPRLSNFDLALGRIEGSAPEEGLPRILGDEAIEEEDALRGLGQGGVWGRPTTPGIFLPSFLLEAAGGRATGS